MRSLFVRWSVLILAAVLLVPAVTPTAATPAYAQATCGTAPAPRLTAGQMARVTVSGSGVGNNLRAASNSTATVLGVMPEGEVFTVVSGPECVENFWWWQVRRSDGQTGWTAEGVTGDYWVEPWPVLGAKIATGPTPDLENVALAFISQPVTATEMKAYAMQVNGTNLRGLGDIPITASLGMIKPAWSPDGTMVAYTDGTNIWVAGQFDITNATQVASGSNLWPTWSPDGTRLAFVSERDSNLEIYAAAADGMSPAQNLTNNLAQDYNPSWSPDGTRIAFSSERTGSAGIFQMGPDGSNLLELVNDPVFGETNPLWSPDGLRLAYLVHHDAYTDLYVLEGSTQRPLTTNAKVQFVAWSPDNKRIAYVAEAAPNQYNLFTVRVDGTDTLQLTIANTAFMGLSWSPDAQWLAFSDNSSGNYDLYAIRANGVGLVNLTNSPSTQDMFPIFQPPTAPGVPQPGVSAAATPAGPAPVQNPAEQDLLLIYDAGVPVFTLQNVSGAPVNLTPLSFSGAGLTVPATLWADYTASPLDSFKNLGCLQLWAFGLPQQPAPAECGDARQGWLTNSGSLFWTQGTFTVLYNNVAVTTCDVAAGRCVVDLP